MPYLNPLTRRYMQDGLYHITQYRPDKGVTHTAILDVGNRVGVPGLSWWPEPMVFHRPPQGFRVDRLSATGAWKLGELVTDEAATIARIREDAAENPEYNVWSSNCEHFTSYAISGERTSPQLQNAVGFVVVAALVGWGLAELSSA